MADQRFSGNRRLFKLALALLALMTVACGDNPTAPTVIQLPDSGQHKTVPVPAGSPAAQGPVVALPAGLTIVGPRAAIGDCLKASTLLGVIEWRIEGVPISAYVDKGYGHDVAAGCGGTIGELRTQNDHLRFERQGSTVIIRFDRSTFTCGHAQVDISLNGINVLGEVVNYGTDCETPDPPCVDCDPPPPPCQIDCEPPCDPSDPTCGRGGPPPPPSDVCIPKGPNATVRMLEKAQNGNFYFEVLPGHTHVLSLVSFILDGVHVYPQKFHERKVETYPAGVYRRYIEPQWRNRQEDIVCTEYPEGQDLTADIAAYWESQTIDGDASQCEWCLIPGLRKQR